MKATFPAIGIDETLTASLERMKITQPTAIQHQAIPLALAGRTLSAGQLQAQAKRWLIFCR